MTVSYKYLVCCMGIVSCGAFHSKKAILNGRPPDIQSFITYLSWK